MKFAEFEIEIDRLKRVYGMAKYPIERVEAIFESVKGLPYDAFRKQVTIFIAEREKAPFLKEFIEAFSGLIADLKKQEIEMKLKNEPPCYECRDVGVSIVYSRETSFSYAYQCSCKRGFLLYPAYPKKFPGMEKSYFTHNEWVSGKVKKELQKTVILGKI